MHIDNIEENIQTIYNLEYKEDGILIAGLTKEGQTKAHLTIPEYINDLPVKYIGDHAFYENKVLTGVTLPGSIVSICKYGFAECRKLEHIQMSLNIKNIGDYAFYNCHSLKSVVLPGTLSSMGYGAFKNCSALEEVYLYTDGVKELAAGALFDDTSHEMNVTVCDMSGKVLTKLVLTEFDYDCILQVEARQFDWVYHGSGNVYRQCITKKGIDFAKYDKLFHSAIHEDWPETAMKIALGRIVYPYKLLDEHRLFYIDYLKNNRQDVFKYYLKSQMADEFDKVLDMIADEDVLKEWIQMARDKNAMSFVSLLMDYQQKHYGKKKKSFAL